MENFISHLKKRQQYLAQKNSDLPTFSIKNIVALLLREYNINVESLGFLGSGSFGVAYGENKVFGEDKVVKITTDPDEVAISKKLIGKKNEHLANIYGVHNVCQDLYLIIQEKLCAQNNSIIEEIERLHDILDEHNSSFPDIVCFEMLEEVLEECEDGEFYFLNEPCSQLCVKIIKAAYAACLEVFEKSSFHADDFHLYNLGLKSNGNIAFFDHTINKLEDYI